MTHGRAGAFGEGLRLDYRTRWQERQRRRHMLWLATVPVGVVLIAIAVLLAHVLSAEGPEWTYAGPRDNLVAPTVAGNQVLAGFSEGQLHCLRLFDGSQVWPEPFRRPERFVSEAAAGAGTAVLCSDYGGVFACSMVDGKGLWRHQLEGATRAAPLLVDDIAYVVSEKGEVRGYRVRTGEEVLSLDTGMALSARPAMSGSTLVAAGSDGVVIGIDTVSGTEKWRRRLGVTFLCPAACVGEMIAIGSEQWRMYLLDPADGRVTATVAAYGLLRLPAVGDKSSVYFADSEGYLYCADPTTGKTRYASRLGRTVDGGPYLHLGSLYCLVDSSILVEIDTTTCRARRSWRMADAASGLAIGSGYAVVGTSSGTVAAVPLD